MKKQLSLNLYQGKHGGRRPNSGRKRIHSKGVSHSQRELINSHTPVHINFKYCAYIQTNRVLDILHIAFLNAIKHNFHVTHFTLQSNHVHIIAETINNQTLITGMRCITNTIVKRIGKGSLQIERYHLHVLRTPQETRNAIAYVLNNELRHTGKTKKNFSGTLNIGKCWLLRTTPS